MSKKRKNTMTSDDLMSIIFTPPLYHATSEDVPRGSVVYSKKPEFFVCHPDNLDYLRVQLTRRNLVHLRDRPLPFVPMGFDCIEDYVDSILSALQDLKE